VKLGSLLICQIVIYQQNSNEIYGDFSFSDILCSFCYRIAVRDEVAFQMNGINTNVRTSNFEPCESEPPWRVIGQKFSGDFRGVKVSKKCPSKLFDEL